MEARQLAKQASLSENRLGNQSYRKQLINKWSFLLKGMALDEWTKACVAQLCENQMFEFKNAQQKRGILSESTAASNVPDYVRFIFPVIRRVWSNLIAPGLVSIQPMTAPVGGVFYWEYKYGTTKGSITAGDNMIQHFDRYYSSEFVSGEQLGALGDGSTTTFADTVAFFPIKAASLAQQGMVATFTIGGVVTTSQLIDKGDGTVLASGHVASGTINYTTGAVSVVFGTAPDTGTPVQISYYFNMESSSTNVPQVNVDIQLQEIKANSRKLRFNWSSEAADDMRAMLGMDVESELVSGVASEMSLEVDREIIQDCRNSGTTILNAFDATVPPAITAVEHYRNILTPLTRVSMDIASQTKRGPGNWLVIPTDVAAIFSQLETHGFFKSVFSPGPAPAGMGTQGRPGFPLPAGPQGFGVYQLGVLQNRWTVFLDPYFQSSEMLVGLKGTTFVDAGYVYAPYVPMQVTPTFLEPADFTLRKGIRTRYAKRLLNPAFFGRVTCTGL